MWWPKPINICLAPLFIIIHRYLFLQTNYLVLNHAAYAETFTDMSFLALLYCLVKPPNLNPERLKIELNFMLTELKMIVDQAKYPKISKRNINKRMLPKSFYSFNSIRLHDIKVLDLFRVIKVCAQFEFSYKIDII